MTTMIDAEGAAPSLLMAMELGRREWKLGFTTGVGRATRRRTMRADSWRQVVDEIAAAKARFGVSAEAPVISCYEAGLDGFWVHRYLVSVGVTNLVVDSSSIEVSRRARRAKTDRLDVERLLALLLRYVSGEQSALRVVRVPSEVRARPSAPPRAAGTEARSHAGDKSHHGVARHTRRARHRSYRFSGTARAVDALEWAAAAGRLTNAPGAGMGES